MTVYSGDETTNTITGGDADDTINGNGGNDTLDGGAGDDTLNGGEGNDTLKDNSGNNVLNGGNGDDTLHGLSPYGTNELNGGGGNDKIYAYYPATVDAGDGDDYVSTKGGSTIDLGTGDDMVVINLSEIASPSTITGGTGRDIYIVSDFATSFIVTDFQPGAGGDIIKFNSMFDRIIYPGGNPFGNGFLQLVQSGDDVLFQINNNGTTYTTAVLENVNLADLTSDNFDGVPLDGSALPSNTITGTSGDDSLLGTGVNDTINGLGGTNIINGGLGEDTLNGGDGNDYLYGQNGNDVMYGGAGNDYLYDMDGNNEFHGGADDDRLYGGEGDDLMYGDAGNDMLWGGDGGDTMYGGAGDDTYTVAEVSDVVSETSDGTHDDGGTDTVRSAISYTLGNFVENLTLLGSDNLDATGNKLANTLIGNSGNNILDGKAGADNMQGRGGDDTYIVDNAGDVVTENASEGTDEVKSSVSFTLGANIEILTLTGSSNINGTGNDLDNHLTGNSGSNALDGGAGADNMTGGLGNDVYYVDNLSDVVIEQTDEGTDTIITGLASYTLGANLERLVLSGNGNIDGTGNDLDNRLTGNTGANILDGGTGADVMIGGLGDDQYYVDNAGDTVTELANEGYDTVHAAISFVLGQNIEALTLEGSANINATGNALNNSLIGNAGNNNLTGGAGDDSLTGGGGNDTLIGGTGNDVYWVESSLTTVIEKAGEGLDTVYSSVSYTLAANVEDLNLTGTGDINATGNSLANTLTGNDGSNILDGKTGADHMAGGKGDDTYYVDNIADVVSEQALEGMDTVISSISHTLEENVENLTLSGTSNLNIFGNALDNILIGNSGSNILDGGAGADLMIGGKGNDTYYIDNAGDQIVEAFGEGTDTVDTSVSFYGYLDANANIEKIILTGTENLWAFGNALANTLVGNSGNNVLDGDAGADIMTGGAGDDQYYVDNTGDKITELADEGHDWVYSTITYTLGKNVDHLFLQGTADINGTGNELDNALIGNAGKNILTGGAGNDSLDGGLGADTMMGGVGDDIYEVDNAGDIVKELAGEGNDAVVSTITYTLNNNVETLILDDLGGNIDATGNALDNALFGNESDNILNGAAGADNMAGRGGNDTYYVDNVGDIVWEQLGGDGHDAGGIDSVFSRVTFTLGKYVENLTLTGTSNVNATGNDLANILTGNSGSNRLDGGAGADTMTGGTGNDTYYVDNAGDRVTELSDQGTDTVNASISYSLSANVEKLTLTGTNNINATGNSLANTLTGNSGNNSLNGGIGADKMIGGLGNDTYHVDNAGDTVTELSGQGTDLVDASVSYSLGANVEKLTLTGTDNINATGNSLANTLTGNIGNNILDGGSGADILTGKSGADTFQFGLGSGADKITDFSAAQGDMINLHAYNAHATAIITQVGLDTVINLGDGNIITILNTTATDPAFMSHIVW